MEALYVALGLLGAGVIGNVVAWSVAGRRSRTNWLEEQTRHEVVVHTKTGDSVRGYVAGVYATEVLLERARLLGETGNEYGLDGSVAVPRSNVAFVQALPPAPPARLTVAPAADTAEGS